MADMKALKNKCIITVATTGAWPKKENNPNVPMTPSEIADDVYACWKAGAAVAHLHMRDENGNGTMSADKFRETKKLLNERYPECDIVLNMTTSGDLNATDETRQIHLFFRGVNFDGGAASIELYNFFEEEEYVGIEAQMYSLY